MLGKETTVLPVDKALSVFKSQTNWPSLVNTVSKGRDRDKRVEALEYVFCAGWKARDRPTHEGIKQGGYYRLSGDELQTQIQLIAVAVDEAMKRGVLNEAIMTAIEMVRTNPQMSAAEALLSEAIVWSGKKRA